MKFPEIIMLDQAEYFFYLQSYNYFLWYLPNQRDILV
jgi:hypothetical protein